MLRRQPVTFIANLDVVEKSAFTVVGQIPRMSIPSALTAMPTEGLTAERRLSFSDDVVLTLEGVTRGLALSPEHERIVQTAVREAMALPELNFRTRLNQATTFAGIDATQRRAILVRALSYYREHGVDQNNGETMSRRFQGLRRSEVFTLDLEKAEPRGGSYHRRVTDKEKGTHRYYYSEEEYARREDAHVSGRDTLKKRCHGDVVNAAGDGCSLDDLKTKLGGKYDDAVVKDVIRDGVKGGKLAFDNGTLKRVGAS